MESPHDPWSMPAVRAQLLARRGAVYVTPEGEPLDARYVRALELEAADLGYVLSERLKARLARLSLPSLTVVRGSILAALAARVGANHKHTPLFRSFPDGIPEDTFELFVRKVLVHYARGDEQICPLCRRSGHIHVLSPCRHAVCELCFDGARYTACPVCERHVDRGSPFFATPPEAPRGAPNERVTFRLLDLGEDLDADAHALFLSLCQRAQAMSPDDVAALTALLDAYRERALAWLPAGIPVRENVAHVLGTLFRALPDAESLLPYARRYLLSATDVLRFVAVFSGADPSLQGEERMLPARDGDRVSAKRTKRVKALVRRFRVAKLPRRLRRVLFALMESFEPERLKEDMLRHRSYWVWLGEHLHPHEYAARYPRVAEAFALVRKNAPDGAAAPRFRGFYSRLEAAVNQRDADGMLAVLRERPGELARRLDHTLRIARGDAGATARVLEGFEASARAYATPVLLTLRAMLPTRTRRAGQRVYWPKGTVTKGVSAPDTREVLAGDTIGATVGAIERELLRRFGEKPSVRDVVVDTELARVMVPFNERTASPGAVSLPRGSRVAVPEGVIARLFLHWCEPERGGRETDVDLSVGFYDAAWNHVGVCSFYQLVERTRDGRLLAKSAGDLRDAPFPDGATEFVDVNRVEAVGDDVRYAVMVVNAYSGMAFRELERAYAGVMLRDDPEGAHFDPRTVALRFNVQGDNGIFLPFVLDLERNVLHWLDVYSTGELQFNCVASSNTAITKVCPTLMEYFASGVRPSMCELALLHAAARGERVFLRAGDGSVRLIERREGEGRGAFLRRLTGAAGASGEADAESVGGVVGGGELLPGAAGAPVLAALYKGDLELPRGSAVYALFRERTETTLAASDLIG